ncbi:hypothetical protein [Maribacter sp. 2210JD10-5]|uniref:hypothetical protein n=1 Tax=Maribacter sp. 2210JD10-5 TaxID=3386272 RepID=UPI0039BC8E15
MKGEFIDIAYSYYPKGINFFTEKREINDKYINSREYKKLERERKNYFGYDEKFGFKIIESLKKNNINVELRDSSRILSGDRAFLIQHSGFFYEKELKYYPLCYVFSGIIPYFYSYFVDIDISFEESVFNEGTYKWKKINGILSNLEDKPNFYSLENAISSVISKELGLKKFPKSIINNIIPDIGNNNIEYGSFTYFNAFFLDDFFCVP